MADKQLVKIPVEDRHHGVKAAIPLGILEGKNPGPTLAVLTGMHATEYVSQDGVARFWDSLDPDKISGRVLVVLGADVKAMLAHNMWTNPVDNKRMGGGIVGNKDGTLTEVITHTLWEEVINHADAVIDCHGGEYSEDMYPYVITYASQDPEVHAKNVELAMALGVPYVEVRPEGGGMISEIIASGRPAMVTEIGQRGERDEQYIHAVYESLHNALKHLGMESGQLALWAGKPARMERGIILNTTKAGLYEPAVVVGQWIEKGAVFARVRDFDGILLEEILAPDAGVVLTMINARCIDAGDKSAHFLQGFAGKIGVVRASD